MTCTKEFLSFSDTNDEELIQTTIGKQIKFTDIDNVPQSVKENFIHKITSETNTSKFFNTSDLQSLTYNKKSDLALFHMNINSLQFHFDELETFLANCPIDFQVLGITKSRCKACVRYFLSNFYFFIK